MKIVSHVLAYALALCGGLVVLFLATPIPALLGLGWPKGILLAMPFAAAASILPYVAALILLKVRGRDSLNLHLLVGGLVALASIGLFALVSGLDMARYIINERTLIGSLLSGAVAAYIHVQVTTMFDAGGQGVRT